MKYLFLSDLSNLFKNKYKTIVLYILIILLFSIFLLYEVNDTVVFNHFLNYIFSLQIDFTSDDILEICFTIINYTIYIYLAIYLYSSSLDNLDNIFYRININKFIISKLFVMFITIFLINTIIFIPTVIFYDINITFYMIVKKILFITNIIIMIYNICISKNKYKILTFILIFSLLLLLCFKIEIQNIRLTYLLITLFLTLSINYFIAKSIKFSDLKG